MVGAGLGTSSSTTQPKAVGGGAEESQEQLGLIVVAAMAGE